MGWCVLVLTAGGIFHFPTQDTLPDPSSRIILQIHTSEGPAILRGWDRGSMGMGLLHPHKDSITPVVEHASSAFMKPMLQTFPGGWILQLPEPREIRLELFDVVGRKVARFQARLAQGEHRLTLRGLPQGVYFFRLQAGADRWKGRMVWMGVVR